MTFVNMRKRSIPVIESLKIVSAGIESWQLGGMMRRFSPEKLNVRYLRIGKIQVHIDGYSELACSGIHPRRTSHSMIRYRLLQSQEKDEM